MIRSEEREGSGCSSGGSSVAGGRLRPRGHSSFALADSQAHGNSRLRTFLDQLVLDTEVGKWLDLPMICVMGETSSGKSSLLSNLSGFALPSSHLITTRCPVVLQMTRKKSCDSPQHEARRAFVNVQWKDGVEPPQQQAPRVSKKERQNAKDEDEDGTNDEKLFEERVISQDAWDNGIAKAISDAQDFILQRTGRGVSSHVVSVRVELPQTPSSSSIEEEKVNVDSVEDYLCELTLIDLPGLVRTKAHDESDDLITEVDALTETYLRNPRCLILAVLPANVDFHNSQILAAARKVDPKGMRTLPVLTKPDLIDPGAENGVLDLLLGEKIPSRLGFHMIKARGQAALDERVTIEEALEMEEKFFAEMKPWSDVEDRTLFGTMNLLDKLGDVQMSMIRKCVPDILLDIRKRQRQTRAALDDLGGIDDMRNSTANKRRYYQDLCQILISCLQSSLSGRGGAFTSSRYAERRPFIKEQYATTSPRVSKSKSHFPQRKNSPSSSSSSAATLLHEACTKFVQQIRVGSLSTVRTVVEGAHVIITSARGNVSGEIVHLDETFVCADYVHDVDRQSEALFEYVGLTSKDASVEEHAVWSDGTKVYIGRKGNKFDSLRKIPFEYIRTDPRWLKHRIKENRTDELPCFLNADIFKNVVRDFIDEDWMPHCWALLESTRQIVLATSMDAVQEAFSNGGGLSSSKRFPMLQAFIERQCRSVTNELIERAGQQVHSHLEMEKHPYTHDHSLYKHIARSRHDPLKRELRMALRLDSAGGNNGSINKGVYDATTIQAILESVFERHEQRSMEDQMAEDMELILESYGKIATKRVMDRTPMICWEVMRSIPVVVQESLWRVTDDQLISCMQELPGHAEKVTKLAAELEDINRALEIFESIE